MCFLCIFFFKRKTADEMRISDWSSDVCSSDLRRSAPGVRVARAAVPRKRATLTPPAGEERMCHAGAASTARESASGRWSPVEFGSMDIVLANPRGFCAGVDRAIEIVKRAIETLGAPIYVRHEVVHNRYVVDDLKQRGAIFVEELHEVPDDATVIFSAHGVSQAVRLEA